MKSQMEPIYPDNQSSWNSMVRFYEDFVARPQWNYLLPLLRLVRTVAASERSAKFRAGQTVAILKVSTTPYHGLKDEDAFVSVDVHDIQNDIAMSFEVTYWKPDRAGTQGWICVEDELLATLDTALGRLWADTKNKD